MKKFIIKENHNINELIKIHADYVMICESEKHIYKCNMLNDLLWHSGFARPVNILQDKEITTYQQLINESEYSLMAFDGMGKKSITAIKDFLYQKNLFLRPENELEKAVIENKKRIASEKADAKRELMLKEKNEKIKKQKLEELRINIENQCRINKENERIEAERKANPIMFIQR